MLLLDAPPLSFSSCFCGNESFRIGNIIIFFMIDQAEQIIETNQKLVNIAPIEQGSRIPVQTQAQIIDTITRSNQQVNAVALKQHQLYQAKRINDIDIKNKISAIKSVQFKSIINPETLKPAAFRQYSIYPTLSKIVLGQVKNLIDMETEINPFTSQLIKMPKGQKPVIKFVTQIVSKSNLQEQFNLLISEFKGNKALSEKINNQMLLPLLQFTLQQLKKTHFIVKKQGFNAALWNKNIAAPVEENNIKQIQTKTLTQRAAQPYASNFDKYCQSFLVKQIVQKRKYQKKKNFFFTEITDPTDLELMVRKAFNQQIQEIFQVYKV